MASQVNPKAPVCERCSEVYGMTFFKSPRNRFNGVVLVFDGYECRGCWTLVTK